MGFEGSKLEKILPNALDLATYAGEDLTFTAINLGRVLNAFGKDADQVLNVANAMGRVLNLTALDFKDFIEAMSYSAPVAKNLGYSFEETAAMIGLLSNRSINWFQSRNWSKKLNVASSWPQQKHQLMLLKRVQLKVGL